MRIRSGNAFAQAYELGLRLSPQVGGRQPLTLVEITSHCPAGTSSFNCCTYNVSSEPKTLGNIVLLDVHFPDERSLVSGQCFRVLHSAETPCDGCPVFEGGLTAPARRVVVPHVYANSHRIVEVARLDAQMMEIRSVSVS